MSNVANFENASLGVRSVVVYSDGAYDVAAFDTDSGNMIGVKSFAAEADAIAYAAKFVSDVVPAGVFVPV